MTTYICFWSIRCAYQSADHHKVICNIRIADLLPSLSPSKVLQIQWLWTELLHLNQTFSKRPEELSQTDIDSYEQQAREWGRRLIKTYQTGNVTPYIHALMNYVSEFMQLHGSIVQFTQHGLEKYNDIVTKDYFRRTSHHGVEPNKCFKMTCSYCGQIGHNKLANLCEAMQTLPTRFLPSTLDEC